MSHEKGAYGELTYSKELDLLSGVREGFPGEVIFLLRSKGGVGENHVKEEGWAEGWAHTKALGGSTAPWRNRKQAGGVPPPS